MKTHIHHDVPKLVRATAPDGSRVYETPSGAAYPSVTSVTGLHNKQAILEWRQRVGEEVANQISRRAATRGTRIHTLCEKYLSNEEVSPDFFDTYMWKTFESQLARIDNIHCLETQLYSDHLEVAGTVDCIAEFDGKLSVIDFKTSSKVKTKDQISNYFMQCSAYAVAFEERTKVPVPNIVIIMGVDDQDDAIIFHEKRDRWIESFIELRTEYKRIKNV